MIVASFLYKPNESSIAIGKGVDISDTYDLVLGFGNKSLITDKEIYNLISDKFKGAQTLLCSTAGEIHNLDVLDNTITLSAIKFEKSTIESASVNIKDFKSSYDAGKELVQKINKKELVGLFVLSDGSLVNGSELVRGIEEEIGHSIPVTGGLAGDGTHFNSTAVGLNALPQSGNIAIIGFYGKNLKISHGSKGGWDVFGLERTVTKSDSNILFEIDNKNALELYKQYLGKYANDLPSSALLFPLSVVLPGVNDPVVRTILSINSDNDSMVFAGDVPVGSKVKFMKANFDNLIDAASDAANTSLSPLTTKSPALTILISCVGRKVILGKRVEEEVEAVADVIGERSVITGFYSYGEISPLTSNGSCQLHNQTMTITTFEET